MYARTPVKPRVMQPWMRPSYSQHRASDLDDPAVLNRPVFINGQEVGTLGGLVSHIVGAPGQLRPSWQGQ